MSAVWDRGSARLEHLSVVYRGRAHDADAAVPDVRRTRPLQSTVCRYCGESLEPGFGAPRGGLWRDGRTLVMDKHAELPNRCVKSNQPADRWLKRRLAWHHPAIVLTVFAGLLVYIIIALVVRKTATIQIGLSEEWYAKRRRATIIGWLLVLTGIGMLVAGIAMVGKKGDVGGPLILFGILVALGGAIGGLMGSRMVYPRKITNTHVWLKGVCPEFLEGLPQWERGRAY